MSLTPEAMVPGLPPLPNSVELFLSIRPERISWLRFLLEGYDGLAVLSTVSATSGIVSMGRPIPPGSGSAVMSMLTTIGS